ncbi:MAG: hypothetical protein IMW85_05870 [Thermicanus sp.]|nr:hypothetical protein [Thermicanus sp.]
MLRTKGEADQIEEKGAAMGKDMAANYSHRTALRFIFLFIYLKKGW